MCSDAFLRIFLFVLPTCATDDSLTIKNTTLSGKTLAFLLPSLEKIIRDKEEHGVHNTKQGIRVLIISPTRELASQIDKEASNLARAHKKLISHQVLYGGVPKGKDMQAMDRRLPTILTATPGRLLDHLESSFLRDRQMDFSEATAEIDVLVLDEMDRLLDMGFSKDIRRIMQYLPDKEQRQTLLFSATVPPSVKQEIRFCTQKNALTVDCIQDEDPSSHTVNTVHQSYVALPHAKQITGVVEIILHLMNSASSSTDNTDATTPKIVVFFNTTSQVAYYSAILRSLGVPRVLEIHSKISQESRSKTSDKFRNAPSMHASILLTSDVSARGVDYPNVTHVLQVGSATDRETYIHRLGRTGRAGKSGKGILVLVHPDEKVVLDKELGGMKIPLDEELHSVLANDGNESSSSGDTEALLERLPGVLQSDALSRKAQDCYRSLLGFYMQRFKALHFRRVSDQVVDMINEFSEQALLKEKPGLSANAVRQHGLSRHPDISIRRQSDYHHRGSGIDAGRGAYGGNQSHHRGGRGDNRGRDRGRSFDRYDSNGGRERSSNRGSDRRGRNEDRRGY